MNTRRRLKLSLPFPFLYLVLLKSHSISMFFLCSKLKTNFPFYLQILGVDNNEGYEISEEEDPDDFSMIGSIGGVNNNLAHSQNAYMIGTEQNPEATPFLSLLRSIISIRRARDVSLNLNKFSYKTFFSFYSSSFVSQSLASVFFLRLF